MFRTIFSIGIVAILGLIAFNLIFHIFGFVMGIFVSLLFVALKIAFFLGLIYLIIRIVSPETARRLRERWSGTAS